MTTLKRYIGRPPTDAQKDRATWNQIRARVIASPVIARGPFPWLAIVDGTLAAVLGASIGVMFALWS